MKEQSVDKCCVRHLMIYEFRKRNNTTNATNDAVYPGALNNKRFKKFKNGDFSIFLTV